MKKVLAVAFCLMLALAGYMAINVVDSNAPTAVAGSAYSGTIYVAGMGGHFAKASIKVDPSNEKAPITVEKLDRVVIGTGKTHPVHDPRIDAMNKDQMFWGTYKKDKEAEGRTVHIGKTDLKTGEVIKDVSLQLPDRVEWDGALYCGSGQSKNAYMPMTMTMEGFIDVFDKETLELKHRVFLDELGYDKNYFFYHGNSSPDLKNLALTVNKTEKWADGKTPAARLGKIDMLLLDLDALDNGKVKVVAKNEITGSTDKTLTFRQSFTPDGKYLLQSGADRMYLLDGKTLELLDEEMMTAGENHDVVTTPDSKYGILTLRVGIKVTEEKSVKDGQLQLYDIAAKKTVGEPASVCMGCHTGIGITGNATLCGADVSWD